MSQILINITLAIEVLICAETISSEKLINNYFDDQKIIHQAKTPSLNFICREY